MNFTPVRRVNKIRVRTELVRHRSVLSKLGIPSTTTLKYDMKEHLAMVRRKK